ncbi:MAG: hypothetical protein HYY06_15780 [Deltaproteobacteria bacterium]|nr:hypothetical protein [Deltaproteobacteria bacterium]
MSRDDRPKKSWREIDSARDRSAHGREERPRGGTRAAERSSSAQKQYRSALDKLFDGGAVGEGWKKVLPEMPADPAVAGRQEELAAIRAATERTTVEAAVARLLERFSLPDDPDVLTQVLLCSDDRIAENALGRLDALLPLRAPAARQVLVARLRRIEDDEDRSPEVRSLAAAVRKKATRSP